jgi:hypothetical protein
MLANHELGERLVDLKYQNEAMNCSNVCDRLSLAEYLDISAADAIDYLASHF